MSRHSRLIVAGCVLVLALIGAGVAAASPWIPLAVGNRWEYRSETGEREVLSITGHEVLRGRDVAVMTFEEGIDAGLQWFWWVDSDGSLYFAGWRDATGIACAWEPPSLELKVPPAVGAQPSAVIQWILVDLDSVIWTGRFRNDVLAEEVLIEPAGAFHAFGVGPIDEPYPSPTFMLESVDRATRGPTGRLRRPHAAAVEPNAVTEWFSEGIGMVRYWSDWFGGPMHLVGSGLPTPARRSSWAAIKRLYQP